MSDNRPTFPARGRHISRSSSRRFPPHPPRPHLPSLSAPGSSNSIIYPLPSSTVESHPQYIHYPPPQPRYPPHASYVHPYASQPMVSAPAYPYSVHTPIDMQGTMGHPMYMHPQQQDSSSSSLSSPRPSPFPQHGHISPPPSVTSGPTHFPNAPGYPSMSYSPQTPTHFGYPSAQPYPNPSFQHTFLQPSFHPPYQADQDNQWWYPSQYDGPQYFHQPPYHIPYQPQQQQSPAERYQQQQSQSGLSADVQLQSPHSAQSHATFTQALPHLQPTAPTSPSPPQSPTKSDSRVKSPPPQNAGKEPAVRQPYHPNPPQRSEWVMWAGNVPSDTTNEELWEFFNKPPASSDGTTEETAGVSSIFLIARSNCAFVNFDTEAHLNAAISRFNGQKIRPDDPKCPSLVCRVRRKTDDLKAGVGGQRGVGLHVKWIRERKQKGKMGAKSPADDATRITPSLTSVSEEEGGAGGDGNRSFEQSSGSGSFASTTSSVLEQHFPKRYFILKSLTQYDLDLSVEKGYWATQKHNEIILDQAYRTSAEVYLIFGVNKSGEFYGYAKMAGPILQSDTKVAWASRTNSPSLARGERINWTPPASSPDPPSTRVILPLSEQRFADSSPSPFTPSPAQGRNIDSHSRHSIAEGVAPSPTDGQEDTFDTDGLYFSGGDYYGDGIRTPNRETVSAPAELHQVHRKITAGTPETHLSSDMAPMRNPYHNQSLPKTRTHSTPISKHVIPSQPTPLTQQAVSEMRQGDPHEFHLDRTAPIRALRHPPASASTGAGGQSGLVMGTIEEHRGQSGTPESMLDPAKIGTPPIVRGNEEPENVQSPGQVDGTTEKRAEELPTWGEPFQLQWIKTERLPFYRTRHLRNPWNHDREVKVSRDGTELEPSVGEALLEEWDREVGEVLPTEKIAQQPGQGGAGGNGRQHGRGKGGAVGGSQKGKR